MSILTLIWCVLGILIDATAIFVAPLAEEATGAPMETITWIALGVSIVCMVINFVLAILALRHSAIGTAYRVSVFTLLALIVFNVAGGDGASGILSSLLGAIIPLLFAVSLAQQNKIDREQEQ